MRLAPDSFDRIVLANVLHLEGPEEARSLVRRAAASLDRGAELVVVDCFADADRRRQTAYAVYALHLAMRTRDGRLHPRGDVERWGREAGLSAGELVTLDPPPWSVSALLQRRPLAKPTTGRRNR